VTHDGRRRAILAIDTATTRVVIATGSPDGRADGVSTWPAGYRHGETLLPSIGRFLGEQNIRRSRLTGIVVGTGPGAFTGLRVGIATAKGLAHGLGVPLVGVSTGEALLAAAGVDDAVLLLPAGPSDRLAVRAGSPAVPVPAGSEPDIASHETLVALDLEDRAPPDAIERGEHARDGLGQALIRLGAAKLAAIAAAGDAQGDGPASELETLVPDYVTLPRGVRAASEVVEWSRDHR
jgi:tRNA threonylcarbamoyl adenosine modification protein YeaZ